MKKYNEIYSRPIAMNMAEENEKIWMALLNRNGICMIDKKTRRAQICKIFENESFEKEFLYYCVEKVGKYLVFSPCEAEKIAIFDLENDTIIYIPLKKIQCVCKENPNISKFCNILKYQSDVYLLGYSYPAIVKINLESLEVTYITNWVEEVENSIEIGDSSGYFSDGYVIKNDSALIPIGCMGAILELDLKNSNTKIRKLNIPMKGIGGISSVDGENIWLVGRVSKTNRVVCWNRQTDNIKEYYLNDLDDDVFAPFHVPFCTIFKVFLMPILSPCIYEINIDTGEIKKNEISDKLFKEGDSSL